MVKYVKYQYSRFCGHAYTTTNTDKTASTKNAPKFGEIDGTSNSTQQRMPLHKNSGQSLTPQPLRDVLEE